jgi:endonuclease/exonuclease/phosphatase family metal-dependent hydrolase
MTYNVHGCLGTDGRLCHERIADVIERFNPDVVCLQELDAQRERSGRLDQTRAIAEILAMDSHFHPALRVAEEEYGDAILSRHPLRLLRACALPTPPSLFLKEQRGAIWVSVTIDGREVQVINTHFGLGRGERRQQASAILGDEWLGAARAAGPVVVCGDFNSPAGGVVHRMFREALTDAQLEVPIIGTRRTFATAFPFVCLDYIFVTPEIRVEAVEIPRTPLTRAASDHFPLIADLDVQLPTQAING